MAHESGAVHEHRGARLEHQHHVHHVRFHVDVVDEHDVHLGSGYVDDIIVVDDFDGALGRWAGLRARASRVL